MLVLSRKKNESIVIGNNIRIEVLKVKGNTIRLGISAPSDVKVLRGELAPYDVSPENSGSDERSDKDNQCAKSCESITIEFDTDSDGTLPNPFVVAQAM